MTELEDLIQKNYKRYSIFKSVKCLVCDTKIYIPIHSAKRKVCGSKCLSIYRKLHPIPNPMLLETARQKSSLSHKGKHYSKETEFKKGVHYSIKTEFKKNNHPSKETEFKKGGVPWNKNKIYHQISGEKHFNWKGGKNAYRGIGWHFIRKKVYERDNYTCQRCYKKNVRLHAHHIIPYRVSQGNSLDNLLTLCTSCHTKTDNSFSLPCPINMTIMIAGVL